MDKADKLYKFISERPDLFADGHAVHTPRALVKEILDKIQLDGSILVMFNIEFVISLVYNYNIDPETITFYSDSENKSLLADKLKVKYITTLEKNMKFDVVLANPPYDAPIEGAKQTKKIWMSFVHKSFDLAKEGGIVGLVNPPSWVLSDNAVLKKIRLRVLKNNLTNLTLGVEKYFPTVGIQIGYSITEMVPYKGTTSFTDSDGTKSMIDFRNGIPMSPEETYRQNLIQKIIKSSKNHYRFILDEKFTNQGYPNKLKLIVNFSKRYWVPSDKSADNNMPITKNAMSCLQGCIYVNSKNEALEHKSFLSSKPIVWFANNYKRRGQTGFCDAIKRHVIPMFQNKIWSDNEVYKVLNLTEDEISYIESNS